MKKALIFADRCRREILRDPLTIVFSVGLPVFLLFLMTAIRNGTGADLFPMDSFGPATAVFAQTFIAMFVGILVAQDRGSAYLTRLFASPLTSWDFILGYSFPLIPLALLQGAVCLGTAAVLGLELSFRLFGALLCLIPSAILFVALGVLLGCLLRETQVGGIASILVQLTAFTSGMWFAPEMVGGAFLSVSRALPFLYAVQSVRGAVSGAFVLTDLLVVIVWAAVFFALAAFVFRRKMTNDAH